MSGAFQLTTQAIEDLDDSWWFIVTLRTVAKTFSQLQEKRHTADYDNTIIWTRTDALTQVRAAEHAFLTWKSIRKERIAQDFLVSMLLKHRD